VLDNQDQRPSAEIWCGAWQGLVTLVTPAACANGPILACSAGERIGTPDRIASVSWSPEAAWKCRARITWPGSLPPKELSAAARNRHPAEDQDRQAGHPSDEGDLAAE
jgi:hypothetical protein